MNVTVSLWTPKKRALSRDLSGIRVKYSLGFRFTVILTACAGTSKLLNEFRIVNNSEQY